jgi:glutathione synthase/RimK-type ligase-like ATP-grasp enzyme
VIVFYGYPDDEPLALAVEAARRAEVPFLLADQGRAARHDLVFGAGLAGTLTVEGGRPLPLAEVSAVYARPLLPPAAGADAAAVARAGAFHAWFTEWLDVAGAFVVNRPAAMESNGSKPYQAQLIARCGFRVPETLVTGDPREVLDFRDRHGRIVYKSVSGVRSVVRELTVRDEKRLGLLGAVPVQFQEYVPGRDVRAHVVGGRVFATAVDSAAVDYRYAERDGLAAELTPCELPPETTRRCTELAAALGLPLTGLDLRVTPGGEWVCFEANPMPAYSFYESHTGQPVAAALVELLVSGGRLPSGAGPARG